MKVGYARTSTVEQQAGFKAQLMALKGAGCEEVFKEQVSSVAKREELEKALHFIRKGDTLIVTKLDRLARSISHLTKIIETLDSKNAFLNILDMKMNTNTANGRLMLNVLGSVAQFEREMMLERQREGIAKAKAEGKYKGRKPTASAKTDEILSLYGQGVKPNHIAQRLEIGRSSVYRILKENAASSH